MAVLNFEGKSLSELGMEPAGTGVNFSVIHEDEWERRFNALFEYAS